MKNIDINFTENEMRALVECLGSLRKKIVAEYESETHRKAINDGVFRSACELQLKIDKAFEPEFDLKIEDYLNLAK